MSSVKSSMLAHEGPAFSQLHSLS